MEKIGSYNPLKWPPDLQLAQIHMRCVCPGKDNVQGLECPCCGRYQKIRVRNWISRNITKDFKSYGGGIPSYFELLKYCGLSLLILSIIVILFHIYIIQTTCPLVLEDYGASKLDLIFHQCQSFLVVFKLCDTKIILETLFRHGQYTKAYAFFYLQLGSFVYLILATIGMKIWLHRVNMQKIVRQDKIYSNYSLMIKNIPKFYQIDDLRKQLLQIVPELQICEIFFVYEIADMENKYKKLFDLHFQVQFLKQSIGSQRGGTREQLDHLIQQYGVLYEQVNELKTKLILNNGRAIVVFNNYEDRNKIYKALQINQCSKLCFHTMKILGKNTQKLHLFADKLCEPQQIIWKHIGESSVAKTWVRIKTTTIGFGFMIAAFLALYFPIVYIDENNVKKHNAVSTALSILISVILQVLAIVYRLIILRILPSRHSSSRDAQSYFIVITTVVFHFFFYIVAPGTYFVLAKDIPVNIKLKQLFVAVLTFLFMSIVIALVDVRYRIFNGRRKKIMSSWTGWGKLCQIRLHEEIRWPSFPIQFKLMVILNIWSFNAFYIFQIPYLMFMFVVVITILYFIDKKNIYKHYKMQVYQSIQLELTVQRDYIVLFLICVCCGYAVCVIRTWQYFFIGAMFIVSFSLNWYLSVREKQQQKQKINEDNRTMTLAELVKAKSTNPKQSMLANLYESEFKQNGYLLDHVSSVSLGSAVLQYGYKQIYDTYLNQFKNKQIISLLDQTYKQYKDPNYNVGAEIEEIRRVTQLSKLTKMRQERSNKSYSTNKVDQIQLQMSRASSFNK